MKPKPTVYLETSVISYLTARPNNHIVIAGHQTFTREWWKLHRTSFDLYVSPLVALEAGAGDKTAASERLKTIADIPNLPVTPQAQTLASHLMATRKLPAKAEEDALHMAIAAVHGINYLLTWNCRHIANAQIRPHVEQCCRKHGHVPPVICTPLELTRENSHA